MNFVQIWWHSRFSSFQTVSFKNHLVLRTIEQLLSDLVHQLFVGCLVQLVLESPHNIISKSAFLRTFLEQFLLENFPFRLCKLWQSTWTLELTATYTAVVSKCWIVPLHVFLVLTVCLLLQSFNWLLTSLLFEHLVKLNSFFPLLSPCLCHLWRRVRLCVFELLLDNCLLYVGRLDWRTIIILSPSRAGSCLSLAKPS